MDNERSEFVLFSFFVFACEGTTERTFSTIRKSASKYSKLVLLNPIDPRIAATNQLKRANSNVAQSIGVGTCRCGARTS